MSQIDIAVLVVIGTGLFKEISPCTFRKYTDRLVEKTGHSYSMRPAFNVSRFERLRITPVQGMIPFTIGGRGKKLFCYLTWCPPLLNPVLCHVDRSPGAVDRDEAETSPCSGCIVS